MPSTTLSRKERRSRIARAAKLYGIKGEESLALHEAYRALARGQTIEALKLAHPVSQSHPTNVHPWIILGGAALDQREGTTALAFFRHAQKIAPKDAVVLGGIAKAHVLEADVENAVLQMERAFAVGNEDAGLATLYLDLMVRLGRRLRAAEKLKPVARRLSDAALCHRLAETLVEADESAAAAPWFEMAWKLDPAPEAHRIGRLLALILTRRFDAADAFVKDLLESAENRDEVVSLYLMNLRLSGRYDEARDLAETHDFTDPAAYAQSRGVVANIEQDLGHDDAAEAAYLEAIHITGSGGKIAKAFGVFKFRAGDYATGFPHYSDRFPDQNRRAIPLENAAPENLGALGRIHLIGEQGIGDQLALLTLLRAAPIDPREKRVILVSDPRFCTALEGNELGIEVVSQDRFFGETQRIDPKELVYLGDLARYLDGTDPAQRQGAYLRPDPERTTALRRKYEEKAKGRPIIGMAWKSANPMGHLRAIPLPELLEAVPGEALVVNLQYGDCRADIAAARAARPDIEIFDDREVDQIADLTAFFAQIAALDRVVTIDNTTAHACGALGHADAHVLIPAGSECMWYWGREGQRDPWYGNLTLHRQDRPRDWQAALRTL